MLRTSLVILLAWAAVRTLALAGEGDSCASDGDCDSSLRCVAAPDGQPHKFCAPEASITARLSDSGGVILVRLDESGPPAWRGFLGARGPRACAGVVDDADRQLGVGAECSWSDARTLRVERRSHGAAVSFDEEGTAARCGTGVSLALVDGAAALMWEPPIDSAAALADDGEWRVPIRGCANVQPPAVLPRAVAMLSVTPQTAARCDDLTLSGVGSWGAGGFPLNFRWRVSLTSPASDEHGDDVAADITEVTMLLDQATLSNNATVVIPSSSIQHGAVYNFSLSVANRFSSSASVAYEIVSTTDEPLLNVGIVGPNSYSLPRTTDLLLRAEVSAPLTHCGLRTQLNVPYTLAWSVSEIVLPDDYPLSRPPFPDLTEPPFVSQDPLEIMLPAMTLKTGCTYTIRARATPADGSIAVRNAAFVRVTVVPGPLTARIDGGHMRRHSVHRELLIDAGTSWDGDGIDELPFAFSWSCAALAGAGDLAPDGDCTTVDGEPLVLAQYAEGARAGGSALRIPADTLPASDVSLYRFTVAYSRGQPDGIVPANLRTSTATTDVFLVDGDAPEVHTSSPLRKISATEVLRIDGSLPEEASLPISTRESVNITWSQEDGDLDWPNVGASFHQTQFLTPLSDLVLKIRPHQLTPGARYSFRLSVALPSETSASTVGVSVNAAPTSGFLLAALPGGSIATTIAVGATVELGAYGWLDDHADLPLSYRFAAVVADLHEGSQERSISQFSFRPALLTTNLPAGRATNARVRVVTYVRDSLGATRRSGLDRNGEEVAVWVRRDSRNGTVGIAWFASLAEQLAGASSAGVVSDILATATFMALSMRTPCGGVKCGAHGACHETTGACECFDGWSGANCESAPAMAAVSLETALRGKSCVGSRNDSSVVGDSLVECFRRGQCVHSTAPLPCHVEISDCIAVCHCNLPWGSHSVDCSLEEDAFQAQVSVLDELGVALQRVLAKLDAYPQATEDLAQSVADTADFAESMSSASLFLLLDTIGAVAAQGTKLDAFPRHGKGVFAALAPSRGIPDPSTVMGLTKQTVEALTLALSRTLHGLEVRAIRQCSVSVRGRLAVPAECVAESKAKYAAAVRTAAHAVLEGALATHVNGEGLLSFSQGNLHLYGRRIDAADSLPLVDLGSEGYMSFPKELQHRLAPLGELKRNLNPGNVERAVDVRAIAWPRGNEDLHLSNSSILAATGRRALVAGTVELGLYRAQVGGESIGYSEVVVDSLARPIHVVLPLRQSLLARRRNETEVWAGVNDDFPACGCWKPQVTHDDNDAGLYPSLTRGTALRSVNLSVTAGVAHVACEVLHTGLYTVVSHVEQATENHRPYRASSGRTVRVLNPPTSMVRDVIVSMVVASCFLWAAAVALDQRWEPRELLRAARRAKYVTSGHLTPASAFDGGDLGLHEAARQLLRQKLRNGDGTAVGLAVSGQLTRLSVDANKTTAPLLRESDGGGTASVVVSSTSRPATCKAHFTFDGDGGRISNRPTQQVSWLQQLGAALAITIRTRHTWVALAVPVLAHAISFTRAQRIVVGLCMVLNGAALVAVCVGKVPALATHTSLMLGVCVGVAMTVTGYALQALFRFVNTPRSATLSAKQAIKASRKPTRPASRGSAVDDDAELSHDNIRRPAVQVAALPPPKGSHHSGTRRGKESATGREPMERPTRTSTAPSMFDDSIKRSLRGLPPDVPVVVARPGICTRIAQYLRSLNAWLWRLPATGAPTPTGMHSGALGWLPGSRRPALRYLMLVAASPSVILLATSLSTALSGVAALLLMHFASTLGGILLISSAVLCATSVPGLVLTAYHRPVSALRAGMCFVFLSAAAAAALCVFLADGSTRGVGVWEHEWRRHWELHGGEACAQGDTPILCDFQSRNLCCGFRDVGDMPVSSTLCNSSAVATETPGCSDKVGKAVLINALILVSACFGGGALGGLLLVALLRRALRQPLPPYAVVSFKRRAVITRPPFLEEEQCAARLGFPYVKRRPPDGWEDYVAQERAARLLQRTLRGGMSRTMTTHLMELIKWERLVWTRRMGLLLAYAVAGSLVAFACWLTVLFGSHFTTAQIESWGIYISIGLGVDMMILQPGLLLVGSVATLVRRRTRVVVAEAVLEMRRYGGFYRRY